MKSKIIVLGGNGMAGHMIAMYLHEKKYNVSILCRKKIILNEHIETILWNEDLKDLENIFNSNFDVVINCIGVLNKFCEENPYLAIKINAFLPHFLTSKIKNEDTKIIHLSTDCVFSGKNAPYNEFSIPDGESIYDITKATGELIIGKNITVLRNSIIGPDINEHGVGLFNWFMHQSCKIKGYDNWIWSGITSLELAKQILYIIENNLYGTFHLTNNQSISKYDLLKIFNSIFKKNILIEKTSLNEKIDKTLIATIGCDLFKIPSYLQMIKELHEWIITHKGVYNYE